MPQQIRVDIKKSSYEQETDHALNEAARAGRAFLEWEALSQIALNLARIADSLREVAV